MSFVPSGTLYYIIRYNLCLLIQFTSLFIKHIQISILRTGAFVFRCKCIYFFKTNDILFFFLFHRIGCSVLLLLPILKVAENNGCLRHLIYEKSPGNNPRLNKALSKVSSPITYNPVRCIRNQYFLQIYMFFFTYKFFFAIQKRQFDLHPETLPFNPPFDTISPSPYFHG